MAKDKLKALVRQWREGQPKLQELKPLLSQARKIEADELALRKEIGELLGDRLSIVIDGKTLIHSKETRNSGFDYEHAWNEAMKILSTRSRRKLETLLKPKVIAIHKLATE